MSQREEQYGGRQGDPRHGDPEQGTQDEERPGEDKKGNPGNPDMGDAAKIDLAPGKPDSVIHKPKPGPEIG